MRNPGKGVAVVHLAQAERRTETPAEAGVAADVEKVDAASGDRRAETVAALRRKIAAVPGTGGVRANRVGVERGAGSGADAASGTGADVDVDAGAAASASGVGILREASREGDPAGAGRSGASGEDRVRFASIGAIPLPRDLRTLVPSGVVEPGAVVALGGGHGAVVALVAAATAAGKRCAIVGYPALGLAAVAAEGGDLSQVALVPMAGADPGVVASVLLDGMDLVVLDPACGRIPPARARVLAGRARSAGTVLVVGAADWHGADLRLEIGPARSAGLEDGYGRISVLSSPARARGRALGGERGGGRLTLRGIPSHSVADLPVRAAEPAARGTVGGVEVRELAAAGRRAG